MPSISISIVCDSISFMVSSIVSVVAITIMIASITSFDFDGEQKEKKERSFIIVINCYKLFDCLNF